VAPAVLPLVLLGSALRRLTALLDYCVAAMTPAAFRKLALALSETEERAHMAHPDFRVANKIFATLGYPDNAWAMVKLPLEQQHNFVQTYPSIFQPVPGGWGRKGATRVNLAKAGAATVRLALTAAWRNTAPKRLVT
jgi:hypothetical protein